jgi:hypothetical protein
MEAEREQTVKMWQGDASSAIVDVMAVWNGSKKRPQGAMHATAV